MIILSRHSIASESDAYVKSVLQSDSSLFDSSKVPPSRVIPIPSNDKYRPPHLQDSSASDATSSEAVDKQNKQIKETERKQQLEHARDKLKLQSTIDAYEKLLNDTRNQLQNQVEKMIKYTATSFSSIQTPANGVKGAIIALARNKERGGMVHSVKSHMKSVNSKFLYPYLFFNDEPFDKNFKEELTRACYPAKAEFHSIPKEYWGFPDWIPVEKARAAFNQMEKEGIQYGGMESYHHMCRYYSGFFFRHPALSNYEYYWRVSISHANVACMPLAFLWSDFYDNNIFRLSLMSTSFVNSITIPFFL
jgi:hypothetical protein